MGIASYSRAQKAGQKEYKALMAQGADPYVCALENILPAGAIIGEEPLGLMSIPMELIAGTRTKARRDCFSASFLPLLEENTEFAAKWAALVDAHLAEGIRDPITAVEYMNRYYVVEGNKRVSVLRYFDSPSVPGNVVRLIPTPADTPEYQVYQEYLAFYHATKINYIQFQRPGKYAELLELLNNEDQRSWDFERQREFFADCTRFRRAYQQVLSQSELDRDEALLRYLKIYGYAHLSSRTPAQLEQDMKAVQAEMNAGLNRPDPNLHMEPERVQSQSGFSWRFWDSKPKGLKIAFLHDKSDETSWWTEAHEKGRIYAQEQFGDQVETVSFFNMLGCADEKIEQLAQDGYKLIFTTTPRLLDATLRAAAKYPNVKFLNCSLNTKHPILRTYYGRMYEAKFLTGALAGASSVSQELGYICNYPVFGAPASINAFALGARMVSPHAKVHLKWSTVNSRSIFAEFREENVDVVSGHDLYSADQPRWAAGVFSLTSSVNDTLAVSTWNWGQIYERIISSVLYGQWLMPGFVDKMGKAINYWWGLSSGAVRVNLSDEVHPGTRQLLSLLEHAIADQKMDIFAGPIYDQNGVLRVKEGETLSPIQIVQMDWLVDNVVGDLPKLEELNPEAQALVQISGVMCGMED